MEAVLLRIEGSVMYSPFTWLSHVVSEMAGQVGSTRDTIPVLNQKCPTSYFFQNPHIYQALIITAGGVSSWNLSPSDDAMATPLGSVSGNEAVA